jgi:hypothetical protein
VKEAHAALREAAKGFEALGATADAEATEREMARVAVAGGIR